MKIPVFLGLPQILGENLVQDKKLKGEGTNYVSCVPDPLPHNHVGSRGAGSVVDTEHFLVTGKSIDRLLRNLSR